MCNHINGRDDKLRTLNFQLFGERVVLFGELNAMPAAWRIVLNKDVVILLKSAVVSFAGEFNYVAILDLFLCFVPRLINCFIDVAFLGICNKLGNRLIYINRISTCNFDSWVGINESVFQIVNQIPQNRIFSLLNLQIALNSFVDVVAL